VLGLISKLLIHGKPYCSGLLLIDFVIARVLASFRIGTQAEEWLLAAKAHFRLEDGPVCGRQILWVSADIEIGELDVVTPDDHFVKIKMLWLILF